MTVEALNTAHPTAETLGKAFAAARVFLQTVDVRTLTLGQKHPIGHFGDQMFALLNEYTTQPKDTRKPEQHRDFIDIHYIVSGSEMISVCFEDARNVVAQPYDKANDVTLYQSVVNETDVVMQPGSYAIFLPSDIHRPGGMNGEPSELKKIVIKVAVELLTKSE